MQLNAADLFFDGFWPVFIVNFLVIAAGFNLPPSRGLRSVCLICLLLSALYLLLTASLFPGCGMAGPILLAGFVAVGVEFGILLHLFLKRLRPPASGPRPGN
jgi:hypothetical protein